MATSDEEELDMASRSWSLARASEESRDQPRHLLSRQEQSDNKHKDMSGESASEEEVDEEEEEEEEEEEFLSDSDDDFVDESHVSETQSTNTSGNNTTRSGINTTRSSNIRSGNNRYQNANSSNNTDANGKPLRYRRSKQLQTGDNPSTLPIRRYTTFYKHDKNVYFNRFPPEKWEHQEFYSDSEDDGYGDMDDVAADIRKYRGIVAAYLGATPIWDVSVQGALQRVKSTTGYVFDEEEQADLVRMIRGMLPTYRKRWDDAGDEPDKHLSDPMVVWYTSGLKERQKMRVRLEELRQRRKKEEVKSRERRKRKREKREKRRREKGKRESKAREVEEEPETATIKTCDDSHFAKQLMEGYTEVFEGVEFYYPAVDDLSDCELLEETPVPAPEEVLTEEMNLAEMIRDSYKVSVEFLEAVEREGSGVDDGSRDEVESDESGSRDSIRSRDEQSLKRLFQSWISQARSKWTSFDVPIMRMNDVDVQARFDPCLFQEYRQKYDRKLEIIEDLTYFTDRTLFSIPTPERTATLEWFDRDWGLSRAAQENHHSTRVNPDSMKPVPVYLVDSSLETEPLGDPGLKHMFEAVGARDLEFDQDSKMSDPFAKRTYYLTDELYALLRHRLLRHRDVIYSLYKHLVSEQEKNPRRIYFKKDLFRIASDDEKLQAVFFDCKKDSFISWAQASRFLFEHHYFITPGCAIRPVDPIFYSEDAHEIYRANRRPVDQITSSTLAPIGKLDKPHKVMTFNAVASTGEVWKRHSSAFYGFRDPTRWEHGMRKWAGAEFLGTVAHPNVTAEMCQEFKDEFNRLTELERTGQGVGEWWIQWTTMKSRLKTLPRIHGWPRFFLQPKKEVDRDQLLNIFHPTWYGEWRRPWQRNRGYSAQEMLAEMAILQGIAKEQEGTWESSKDDRFVRLRDSHLLEDDFYPAAYTKPFKANGSWHFMAPKMYPSEHPQARKRPHDIDRDNPWDQTMFGSAAAQMYGAEAKPVAKHRHFERKLWHNPKRRRALDKYHLEALYGKDRWGDDTFKVQEPKQVYLCFSDDSEDEKEEAREEEEAVAGRYARGASGPIIEEIDDDEVGQDVDVGGYDFGPTVEEVE